MRDETSAQILGQYVTGMSDRAKAYSKNQRDKLAGTKALPDGSFPIENKSDLKNAISAYGRAKNKARAKAHIIKRAKALGATNMLPDDWKDDNAMFTCPEEGCTRAFIDAAAFHDHADSVHTYDEIRQQVSAAVRAKHGRSAQLGQPGVCVWVADLTDTWVVFEVEGNTAAQLWKSEYTIDESGDVDLADPTAVVRKVVYVPDTSSK